ncbi:MAG: helix-turn-helix domain-containing protein [Candidatus Izemoplasmataceae bacterium]
MSVGDNIKKLRYDNGLTQEDLAAKIYVTRNAISKWETNKGIPSIDSLKQLSSLFNVSLDQLVSEEDRIVMALENTKKIQNYKDFFTGISVFLSYCINGILVPYIFLSMDGFNESIVNYILLPLIYIFIGVTSILRDIHWKYLVIGSALGMIPVFMLYDVLLPEYGLGLFGIMHYIIFIVAYFTAKHLIQLLANKFSSKRLRVFFLSGLSLITTIYIIHTTIGAINLNNCIECSAPWNLVLIVNTVFYAIPIIILATLYLHFKKKYEKESKV